MMHARGRTDPDAFAEADHHSTRVAFVHVVLPMSSVAKKIMLFRGQKLVNVYGGILHLPNDEAALDDLIRKRYAVEPYKRMPILAIEQRTLAFLRSRAELLFEDLPVHDTSIPTEPQPRLIALQSLSSSGQQDERSLRRELLETSYGVPGAPNIWRLR